MLKEKNSKIHKIGTSAFYTIINPALVLSLIMGYISGSVKIEWLSQKLGVELLSLYGFLSYENAFSISGVLNEFLNEYSLIPAIVFLGIMIFIFQRYRQSNVKKSKKARWIDAISLGVIEGCILCFALLGGLFGDMATLFPDAIKNWTFVLGITVPMIIIGPLRPWIAEKICKFFEKNAIWKTYQ